MGAHVHVMCEDCVLFISEWRISARPYGEIVNEALHATRCLGDEHIDVLHIGLFRAKPRQIGQILQRLCNERESARSVLSRVV